MQLEKIPTGATQPLTLIKLILWIFSSYLQTYSSRHIIKFNIFEIFFGIFKTVQIFSYFVNYSTYKNSIFSKLKFSDASYFDGCSRTCVKDKYLLPLTQFDNLEIVVYGQVCDILFNFATLKWFRFSQFWCFSQFLRMRLLR